MDRKIVVPILRFVYLVDGLFDGNLSEQSLENLFRPGHHSYFPDLAVDLANACEELCCSNDDKYSQYRPSEKSMHALIEIIFWISKKYHYAGFECFLSF